MQKSNRLTHVRMLHNLKLILLVMFACVVVSALIGCPLKPMRSIQIIRTDDDAVARLWCREDLPTSCYSEDNGDLILVLPTIDGDEAAYTYLLATKPNTIRFGR